MRGSRSLVLAAFLLAAAAPPSSAEAALNAYLTLKGQKQGQLKGGVIQKGRENSLRVLAVSHSIVSPRDQASGQATGKRQHKPMVVRVELDRAAPLLHQALVSNESFSELTLRFWAPQVGKVGAGAGAETNTYTVRLTNAALSEIKTIHAEDPKVPDTIELSFTYQKIEWIWNDGGITATDDWEGGKSKGL
jgi:type VI secretion system secreted protein Hcp